MCSPLTAALVGLSVVLAAQTVAWAVSVRLRDASIADICWGPGFVLLAWLYCVLLPSSGQRPVLVASLVTLWGARLAAHIFWRHRGEDPRYRSMRESQGGAFWWRSLFTVFWLQGVLMWFVALPILAAQKSEPALFTLSDKTGLLLFGTGFLFEAIGDHQLTRFKAVADNRGRTMDSGLWRYTRHPNYFGDAVLWWGVYLMATSAEHAWLTIASPALMTFLLVRVSGITLLERALVQSKPDYASYVKRTSAFLPWFPRRS